MRYIFIIFGAMVIDRIVKTAVVAGMRVGESIPVMGNFFHITYAQNTGAAFSMLQGHPVLLLVLPGIVISIAIIYLIVKYKSYKPVFNVALALMCGGGLGNLTDRAAYGYVIDMFDFGFFPVFNVADICVCTGCGMLMVYLIIYNNKNPGIREDTLEGSRTVESPQQKAAVKPQEKKRQENARNKKPKRLK